MTYNREKAKKNIWLNYSSSNRVPENRKFGNFSWKSNAHNTIIMLELNNSNSFRPCLHSTDGRRRRKGGATEGVEMVPQLASAQV